MKRLPPPFLGGQGRSPESVIADAGVLFWVAIAALAWGAAIMMFGGAA